MALSFIQANFSVITVWCITLCSLQFLLRKSARTLLYFKTVKDARFRGKTVLSSIWLEHAGNGYYQRAGKQPNSSVTEWCIICSAWLLLIFNKSPIVGFDPEHNFQIYKTHVPVSLFLCVFLGGELIIWSNKWHSALTLEAALSVCYLCWSLTRLMWTRRCTLLCLMLLAM